MRNRWYTTKSTVLVQNGEQQLIRAVGSRNPESSWRASSTAARIALKQPLLKSVDTADMKPIENTCRSIGQLIGHTAEGYRGSACAGITT
jgi:hypothetical protein